jgi:hypothetical protein
MDKYVKDNTNRYLLTFLLLLMANLMKAFMVLQERPFILQLIQEIPSERCLGGQNMMPWGHDKNIPLVALGQRWVH